MAPTRETPAANLVPEPVPDDGSSSSDSDDYFAVAPPLPVPDVAEPVPVLSPRTARAIALMVRGL